MKKIAVLFVAVLTLPLMSLAEEYRLKPDLKVVLPEVPAPWSVSTEPPPELVEHLAEHLREEAAEKGKTLPADQARQLARQHAGENELFVLNRESNAHLLISVSPLREGESPPSAKSVALSAKYAAEGVVDEGWADVSSRQAVTTIKGAQFAQWFSIDYTHEQERSLFMGVVGFARPYWFWFYGNDHLKDPRDRAVLERIILGTKIQVESR